jgi:hypothetical protein
MIGARKRMEVVDALDNLLHKRFNKESLEKKLSEIFEEEIHIALGCEDVDYLTDWDYMFTSEREDIGGDFDIYVLFHKDMRKGCDDAQFMVTEVAYDFFEN